MSVVSLDSLGAAVTGGTGLTGFFLFGDAAAAGFTGVANFLLEAEGVCNIKVKNSMG